MQVSLDSVFVHSFIFIESYLWQLKMKNNEMNGWMVRLIYSLIATIISHFVLKWSLIFSFRRHMCVHRLTTRRKRLWEWMLTHSAWCAHSSDVCVCVCAVENRQTFRDAGRFSFKDAVECISLDKRQQMCMRITICAAKSYAHTYGRKKIAEII